MVRRCILPSLVAVVAATAGMGRSANAASTKSLWELELEKRILELEFLVKKQQESLTSLHQTVSSIRALLATGPSTLRDVDRPVSSDSESTEGARLSVCLAIPCIPRHLGNLRQVLWDVAAQTVLPSEVVVSISETSVDEGDALAADLAAEIFGDARSTALRPSRPWPTLKVVAATERQTHAVNNNIAASHCSSDIVSWFDADDRMHPRRVEVRPFNGATRLL